MVRLPAALLLSSALALGGVLGGCMPVVAGVATPMIIQQKHVNLTNASYAAADSISQQAGKRFPPGRPLVVENLQEIIDMNQKKPVANPKVGIVISEQMRDRFTQLGYNVAQSPVYQGGGAPGVVSGTYEFVSDTMHVALRLTNSDTGQVITIYNYSLPMTYDIKKYMSGNAGMLPPLF